MRTILIVAALAALTAVPKAQERRRPSVDAVLARTTYAEVQRLRLDGGCATALAFSTDGRWLAVGGA
jgi:hypothetical protein